MLHKVTVMLICIIIAFSWSPVSISAEAVGMNNKQMARIALIEFDNGQKITFGDVVANLPQKQ